MLSAALLVGGCHKADKPADRPPPAVTVAHPGAREVVDWDEYTGYLESPQSVNLRARVGGELTKVNFDEGSLVHRGDVLVQIDRRPFQAELDARRASVEQAKAAATLAQITFKRNAEAVANRAVSQTEYDTAKANYEQAVAQQRSAEAAVMSAQLNVQWCDVVAPIAGRISSRYVTAGNLVSGGTDTGTLLTTIQSVDPMYCYVDVDERSVLKYKQLAAAAATRPATGPTVNGSADRPRFATYMGLINEAGTPHAGRIDFVDNRVDANTGTLRLRGVFPNPEGLLEPGLFARMRVPGSGRYRAVLIPDAAIGTQQNLKFVYTLAADQTVKLRPITLGTLFGTLRSVVSGLTTDDQIVINGLVSLRDGAKVSPQLASVPMEQFATTADRSPTTQLLPATATPSPTADLGAGRPPGGGGTDASPATRPTGGGR